MKTKRRIRIPILAKTAIVIFVFSVIIVEIAMTYFSLVTSNRNKETYMNYADSISCTISKTIDVDDFNYLRNKVCSILDTIPEEERAYFNEGDEDKIAEYMEHYAPLYEDNEFVTKFNRTRDYLREMVQINEKFHVSWVYLGFIYSYADSNGIQQGLCVYLVDSADEEEACPPGWIDYLYDENRDVLTDQTRGFPAYTTNTPEYGYLITAGTYISTTDRGYLYVDISMKAVRARQANSIVRLFVYLTSTIVLLSIVGLLIVHFLFARPLKKMTSVAQTFNNNDPKLSHQNFVELSIATHDEMSDLLDSIKEMENGVVERFDEITKMNVALVDSERETAKMTALANRDSLTGVGSKTAYDVEVEKIDEKIKNKEKIAFGIAMIDLNYLKNTNDEFGHSAGDDALVRLANVICLTFQHSPVYRIGGDEFVVILRNADYKNASKLIKEFKEKIHYCITNKKVPEYERVSAAIGYSEYNELEDNSVEDVFNRADAIMYQCKHRMKEEN